MLAQFGRLLRAVADGPDPARIPPPSEVIAMLPVREPLGDLAYLRDELLYAGSAQEAASAGVRSQVAIYNPAASKVIALVESFSVLCPTNYVFIRQVNASDIAAFDNDGTENARDPRVSFDTGGAHYGRYATCRVLTDQAAAVGTVIQRIYPRYTDATNYHYHETTQFVLLPGTGINFIPHTDNNLCGASLVWRERLLDEKELAGTDGRFFR